MATALEKLNLLMGLLGGEVARTGPFFVTVILTNRCNLDCLGCPYHSQYVSKSTQAPGALRDAPLDQLRELFDALRAMKTRSVTLSGHGEPFLYPHIFEAISLAKRAGMQVTVFTNGTFLDPPTVRRLVECGLDLLQVTLWANSAEEYGQNHPNSDPDNYRKAVDGLRLLARQKAEASRDLPRVVLHQPLHRYNFEGVAATAELAGATGCQAVSFSPLQPVRGAVAFLALSPMEEQRLLVSLGQIRMRLRELGMGHNIGEVMQSYRIGEAVWRKVPCYIGWLHAYVQLDGTVVPCCRQLDMPMGNINEGGFRQAWNGQGYRGFRRRTLTLEGTEQVAQDGGCAFCCYLKDNVRVHRWFRWLRAFGSR